MCWQLILWLDYLEAHTKTAFPNADWNVSACLEIRPLQFCRRSKVFKRPTTPPERAVGVGQCSWKHLQARAEDGSCRQVCYLFTFIIIYQLLLMVFFGRFLVVLALVGASVAERRLRGNAQPRDEVRIIISIWIWISQKMKWEYPFGFIGSAPTGQQANERIETLFPDSKCFKCSKKF